jgi:hypothetical protein
VEPELKRLIVEAAAKTRLSQADVMRSALRIGVPEVVKRLEPRTRPKRSIVEYIDLFAEAGILKHRNRELVKPSRFLK